MTAMFVNLPVTDLERAKAFYTAIGFTINPHVTAANCRTCHEPIYQQFLRSRHAAPAWAAVAGSADFTAEQVAFSEKFQPGATKRPPNALALLEGHAAISSGWSAL